MKRRFFDLHVDTPSAIYDSHSRFAENALQLDAQRAYKYQPYAAFYSFFGNSAKSSLNGRFDGAYANFMREIKGIAHVCTTSHDIDTAMSEGLLPAFLSVEGAEMIGASPAGVEKAYARGVRLCGITWNNPNGMADEHGLTSAGHAYVSACAKIGITVDISHLSDAATHDLFMTYDASRLKIIASHSNCRAVRAHKRNLTDDQLKELISRKGLVGLNLYSAFVAGDGSTTDDLARHAAHVAELGGLRSLALGTDFDGCDELCGLKGAQELFQLYDAFLRAGFNERETDAILYGNAYAFFANNA